MSTRPAPSRPPLARTVRFLAAVLLLCACDKKPAPGRPKPAKGDRSTVLATCKDPSVHVCREYSGSVPLLAEERCKGAAGKGVLERGDTPCPRDNVLGTCTILDEDASETYYAYREPGGDDPAAAKASCERNGGAWTAATAKK